MKANTNPFRLTVLLSAAPLLAAAVTFATAWVAPLRLGPTAVRFFMYVMLLEFIVVHSTGFLGMTMLTEANRRRRALKFAGLLAFYSIFAGVFSLASQSFWPLINFWVLTLIKVPGMVINRPPVPAQRALREQWVVMIVAYIVFAGFTTLMPLPHLGITPEVVAGQGFLTGGLWVEQPHRVMAFGFFYFGALGLWELWKPFRNQDESDLENV